MVKDNTPLVGIMISVFIAILLGVVMLSISADQVNDITGLKSTTDASVTQTINLSAAVATAATTVTEAPTGWKANGECALTNFVLTNSTGTALTLTTDYAVDLDAGTYTLVNSTAVAALSDNVTIASYTYCPDGYQTGFGGASLNLVPGFFALAILVSVAFLIFWILRREGIDI